MVTKHVQTARWRLAGSNTEISGNRKELGPGERQGCCLEESGAGGGGTE